MKNIVRDFIRANALNTRLNSERSMRASVRSRLLSFIEELNSADKIEYTGWYVFLKEEKDGWKAIKCFNPEVDKEEDCPEEFDLCLMIPKPDTLREFEGF